MATRRVGKKKRKVAKKKRKSAFTFKATFPTRFGAKYYHNYVQTDGKAVGAKVSKIC